MRHGNTSSQIRRFINSLANDQLFSTRDCLNFGPRPAVDQALYKHVRAGSIKRLARGVFIKANGESVAPSPRVIAAFKAKAFHRLAHKAADEAENVLLRRASESLRIATNGESSSLSVGNQRAQLEKFCPRKLALGDSKAALLIRAMWERGPSEITAAVIQEATSTFGRSDFAELRAACHLMPSWLADKLVWQFQRNRKTRRVAQTESPPTSASSETQNNFDEIEQLPPNGSIL